MTLIDEALDHPGSGEDYGPGTIIGLRVKIKVDAANSEERALCPFVIMVLPQGLSVPTVNTVATQKQNEKYIWGITTTGSNAGLGGSSDMVHTCDFAPHTVRKMQPGDRLVVVFMNSGGTAFGAGATEDKWAELYIRED